MNYLNKVKNDKYLGVILACQQNFKSEIKYLSQKWRTVLIISELSGNV